MKDLHGLIEQMFTPGTVPCTIFGAVLGVIFAVLCLTIGILRALLIGIFCAIGVFVGGVKDKRQFISSIYTFFHREDNQY